MGALKKVMLKKSLKKNKMGSQYDVPSDVDSDKEITNNNDSDEEVSESDEKLNEGSDEEQRNEESECEEEENLDSDQEDVNDESDEEMIEFDEEVNESDEGISNESEEDEDAAPKVVSMSSGKRKVMDDIQKRINLKSSNETAQKKALKEKRAKRLNMYQQQRIDKEKVSIYFYNKSVKIYNKVLYKPLVKFKSMFMQFGNFFKG